MSTIASMNMSKQDYHREAIDLLSSHLPYCLPILRRLQFHLQTEYSQILTSFDQAMNPDIGTCFAIAYLDRSRRSETECWLYLSNEKPEHCSSSPNCLGCKDAVLSILSQIASLPLPPSVHGMPGRADLSTGSLEAHALNHDIMLAGSVHEKIAKIINEAGFGLTDMPGHSLRYTKYIFDIDSLPGDEILPPGLIWGNVREEDFDLVRSRTSIPRKNATLKILPSIAIFPDADDPGTTAPIAWAFLGVDSSLSSLHVEPEYRGRGLAKKMAAKIWRGSLTSIRVLPANVESTNGKDISQRIKNYGHADVAIDNVESNAVCRSLGGKASWIVYWLRIDLAAVRDASLKAR